MNHKIPLVIIVGPTAVGKTDLSINVAKSINGEIISADSMQIYKYMDIGTAKIKKNEMRGISHYIIDEVDPDQEFSVSDFQNNAKKYINKIYKESKVPIIAGGTGLYINSIVYNLDFIGAEANQEYRDELLNKSNELGSEHIYNMLKEIDPESANRIHPNNTKRVIRALEVYKQTGKPMSFYYNNFREQNTEYDLAFVGLNMDRKTLYDRINKRVDIMIDEGLVNEVNNLLKKGYSKELTSMQGLGYKEIIEYLEGKISLEQAIETLKRDTRRYAKRQLTWFRRDDRIHWFNVDEYSDREKLSEHITNYIKEKLSLNSKEV